MRKLFQWVCWICMPVFLSSAQERVPSRPPFDPAKSGVKVVFAPELPGARPKAPANPLPFAAPRGATGISLGEEYMTVAVVTVGDDGRLQLQCAPMAEAVRRVRSARPAPQASRKGAAYEK